MPIDWEWQLGPIYFNTRQEPDDLGCLWAIDGIPDGWDSPEFRGTTNNIPWDDGADVPDAFDGPRIIHGTGAVVAIPTRTDPDGAIGLERAKSRLKSVLRGMLRGDGRFTSRPWDGGPDRYCAVRCGGKPAFPTRDAPNVTEFDFLLVAGDPRKYSTAASASAAVSSSTAFGGVTYPVSYPVVYAADADTLTPTATSMNPGDETAPYVATFVGPLNNPILVGRVTGQRIPLTATLPEGAAPIVVDTLAQTITQAGQPAYHLWDSTTGTPLDELAIPAEGQENWLLLGGGDGQCLITASPVWL